MQQHYTPISAKGILIGINGQQKRLWFELNNSDNAEACFSKACIEINNIETSDMSDLINKVIELFAVYGIERIAK